MIAFPRPPAAQTVRTPADRYPGALPFSDTPLDWLRFFGREDETQALLHQLLSVELLVFFGRSGVGKTSLVNAALFPLLRKRDFLPVLVRFNESKPPLQIVETAVAEACKREQIDYTPGNNGSLWEFFKTAIFWRDDRIQIPVLVLDQFEEVFTLQREEFRRTLAAELGQLTASRVPEHLRRRVVGQEAEEGAADHGGPLPFTEKPPEIKTLISLREDYLGALQELAAAVPGILLNRFRITGLSEENARRAITEPTVLVSEDVKFSTKAFNYRREAIDQIIAAARDQEQCSIEPFFLQILCSHVEKQVREKQASAKPGDPGLEVDGSYLGGEKGIEVLAANFYLDAVNRLPEPGLRDRARQLCEEGLLTNTGRRRNLLKEDIETNFRLDNGSLTILEEAHLLRKEPKHGSFSYEISHDRLAAAISDKRVRREVKELHRRLWRTQLLAGLAVVTALAIGAAFYAFYQREAALASASRADVSLAIYSREAGNDVEALAHLARALRRNGRNSEAGVLTTALLTQESWPVVTGSLKHDGPVLSAQFSADGCRVVTASEDQTARIWDAASGQEIGRPMRHEKAVNSAQFSPDRHWVVTASEDQTARIWDAASGQAIGEPMRHDAPVHSAQFSPDGRRVVTASGAASGEQTARVWDAATGKALSQPMAHDGAVNSAQFSPDGRRVVTASEDQTAQIWDGATGKRIGEPMRHEKAVNSAQFSPDGRRVVTASEDQTARIWDTTSGQAIGEPMRHEKAVNSAQFSPDGHRVVTASEDQTARIWDAASGQAIGEPMRHDAPVHSAQFSPDGQRVVTASGDQTARVWDAATGKALSEPMKQDGAITSAQFSPDGQQLVTASRDQTARVWDAATCEAIGEPMRHQKAVNSAQLSADGQRVVTASWDYTARVWNAATGKAISEPMRHDGAVNSAQFSPDGQWVMTASGDHTQIWDAGGKAIRETMRHDGAVNSAQFSPDGRRVVTASEDQTAQIWDAATGKRIGKPMRHKNAVNSAQFSPDGKRVVTASADRTAQIWDTVTGIAIGEPMRHDDSVSSAQFSPDGQRVVTASGDFKAQVWNAVTSKAIGVPMRHHGAVNSAQFSPDGHWVVTASEDRTAQIWDAATGNAIWGPMRHEGPVRSAQFSADGQRLVTASWDNTARVWDAATGKAVGEPMRHQGPVQSAQFSVDGQRVVTASFDKAARVWDVPTTGSQDSPDDVLLLADLAEAASGSVFPTSEQTEILKHLPSGEVRNRRSKIAAKFEPQSAGLAPVERLLKWSVSDPRTRTISPFSELTFPEWIENTIKEGELENLRAAIQMDPANAPLLAHFGLALAKIAVAEVAADPDEAGRAKAEADYQTSRAAKLAPDNEQVKQLRTEVVKLLQLTEQ